MGFRVRLLLATGLLAVLAALFVVGLLLSPQQRRARAAGAPLLPGIVGAGIEGLDIVGPGASELRLRLRDGSWEVRSDGQFLPGGGQSFPASADRVLSLLRLASSLQRGALVTRDPGRSAELGLGEREERLLVLHLDGRPDVALEVGARAPSGEEDYIRIRGDAAVYLVRGNLSVILAQDRTYWYDLRLLPADVQPQSLTRIVVRGSVDLGSPGGLLEGGYALQRASVESGGGWTMPGAGRPVDSLAADSLAGELALLEAEDFLEARPGPRTAPSGAGLEVEVTTIEGKTYRLEVHAGPEPGLVLVTTSWSPWTYLVRAAVLRRAVRPASELLAAR
jgi:hypothetical protein